MEARLKYEQAQDTMNLMTARYMVEKNILVAKREAVILDINRAIGAGEDISGLQDLMVELNAQIEDLDAETNQVLPRLQNEVTGAYKELQYTSKEVIKRVSADFKNSYKQTRAYREDGVLKGESTDLIKNGNRVVLNTAYDADVIANGKLPSITAQTININGQTVRVINNEHSGGVESSYLDGNTEQMRTGSGDTQFMTRDENGSLIADTPELEDALKKIGIEGVDDIEEACDAIDEKAAERDAEEIDDDYDDYQPPLNYNY